MVSPTEKISGPFVQENDPRYAFFRKTWIVKFELISYFTVLQALVDHAV